MKWATAIVVALLAAGSTFADVGPSPFQKHAHAVHRIETQESQPDYVFVLARSGLQHDENTRRWNEYYEAEYLELGPEQPIEIRLAPHVRDGAHGQRSKEEAVLHCIPRSLAQAHPSAKEAIAAAGWGKYPGTFSKRFDWREAVPSWDADEITITYRVQRSKSGGLEIVRTSRDPLRQWNAAAIGVSICLAATVILFGLWLVRRMLRSRPIPTAK